MLVVVLLFYLVREVDVSGPLENVLRSPLAPQFGSPPYPVAGGSVSPPYPPQSFPVDKNALQPGVNYQTPFTSPLQRPHGTFPSVGWNQAVLQQVFQLPGSRFVKDKPKTLKLLGDAPPELFGPQTTVQKAEKNVYRNLDLVEILPPHETTAPLSVTDLFPQICKTFERELLKPHRSNEHLEERPDGLSNVGLVYLDQEETDVMYMPPVDPEKGQGSLQLLKNRLHSRLSPRDAQRATQAIIEKMDAYWKLLREVVVANDVFRESVRTYGLRLTISFRLDLVCFLTREKQTRVVHPTRAGTMLFANIAPFIYLFSVSGNTDRVRAQPIEPTGWVSLCLVGSRPLEEVSHNEVDTVALNRMMFWSEPFIWEETIAPPYSDRSARFGASTLESSLVNQLVRSSYEDRYVDFGCYHHQLYSSRRQSLLYSDDSENVFRGYCVILPVEPNRLYPTERVMIHCNDVYPIGTLAVEVFSVKDFENRKKVFFYLNQCSHDGWSRRSMTEVAGRKFLKECEVVTSSHQAPQSQWKWTSGNSVA